jgi:hypothetical protein
MTARERQDRSTELVRRYLLDVWGGGEVALLDQLLADTFCDHDAPRATPATWQGTAGSSGT